MPDIPSLLNTHVATHIDLHARLKQAHWNCTGPNFIGLHKLFDDAADQIESYYDTLAERARALGAEAEGTLEAVSDGSILPAYTLGVADGQKHVAAIVKDLTAVSTEGRRAIKSCLDDGDQATADVFIEITRGLDQLRYLIGSHQ